LQGDQAVLTQKPCVVDLEMSDTEYLNLLSQGRDPVKETLYIQELTAFGFTSDYTQQVAPLFDKPDCTIAEKILVNRTLKQIWKQLIKQIQ
jgi:hypothetical protein